MSYTFDEVFLATDIVTENETVLGAIPHDSQRNEFGTIEEQYHLVGKCFVFKVYHLIAMVWTLMAMLALPL